MRKTCLALALAGCLAVTAQPSYAWGHHYHGGRGGGGAVVGALVGGALLGAVVGSAASRPVYAAPAPVYAAPTTVYYEPAPAPPPVRYYRAPAYDYYGRPVYSERVYYGPPPPPPGW